MVTIYTQISDRLEIRNLLDQLLKDKYSLSDSNRNQNLNSIEHFLNHLKDDIKILVEHPYVDKVYRDSYYHYYASKNDIYHRDCIRLSFFSNTITLEDFSEAKKLELLENSYLGFLVVRPTFPFPLGRCLISKNALKENDFKISQVSVNVTANNLKFDVSGFPHSSQNGETITCAETTIWALMEYFGNRYPEYTPTLPSKISNTLNLQSVERLLPSQGLTAHQISYALKILGFGVKIYSKKAFGDDFFALLKTYVESGIPVVVAIENDQNIGHVQNIVGRARFKDSDVDNLNNSIDYGRGVIVHDFEDLEIEYIFMDDNHPPYQKSSLDKPSSFYNNPKWKNCQITNFIVPLYPKIYLEASDARLVAKSFLKIFIEDLKLITNKEIIIKTFLTSSRSFKNELAHNIIDPTAKELILSLPMPKFIWITEITDKKLIKNNLIDGLLILDATEPKRKSLIAGLLGNHYITLNLSEVTKINLPLHPFNCFNNNLK